MHTHIPSYTCTTQAPHHHTPSPSPSPYTTITITITIHHHHHHHHQITGLYYTFTSNNSIHYTFTSNNSIHYTFTSRSIATLTVLLIRIIHWFIQPHLILTALDGLPLGTLLVSTTRGIPHLTPQETHPNKYQHDTYHTHHHQHQDDDPVPILIFLLGRVSIPCTGWWDIAPIEGLGDVT